jgi:zinc transport system substrate-binding protein
MGIVPILESAMKGVRSVAPGVLCGALLLTLAACRTVQGSAASGGKLTVVAGFYPVAEAAQQVGGASVRVENLTPPGVEPHDLELAPNQLEEIASADVVLYLGEGFAPAVQQAVGSAEGETVDLLSGMPLQQGVPEPGQSGDILDPHVWLDPALYQRMVDRVETALAQADPPHASTFAANARRFDAQLTALDGEYRNGLASCQRNVIVTSHAAFGYLSRRYGLVQEPIAGLAPDVEPGPERLAQLTALVRRDGVTTIFTEQLVSPRVAQTLAQETGATTAVLNPLEGLTEQQIGDGQDYIGVMRQNLGILERALGCG